jgi:hypothetical protein
LESLSVSPEPLAGSLGSLSVACAGRATNVLAAAPATIATNDRLDSGRTFLDNSAPQRLVSPETK